MAVLSSRALQEQLSIIMGALTKAAVAEICELVDEGYAALQLEISRSRKENEDLRKKLHLIESIVVRGGKAALPEPGAAQAEPPPEDGDGDGDGGVLLREELPEVVLIKDEDSDTNDTFEEGPGPADREAAGSVKRLWPGAEEEPRPEQRPEPPGAHSAAVSVYSLDSPRSEPGRPEAEPLCAYPPLDPDLQLLHQDPAGRQAFFGAGALTESPSGRAEVDLSLTWTKAAKGPGPFAQFHPNEGLDSSAFGLKLVSVSGSTPSDCQLSEGSNSAFEYEDADVMSFGLYRDPAARAQLCGGPPGPGARGKRFICSVCNKTYATSQNLEVHMRIHTGERPFSCSQCGKKFTQSAHLKSHLSVHSGERPYACALCSRSFIVKYSLKLHMKKCHSAV